MSIETFNKNIDDILKTGNIENIPILNVDIMRNIIMNKKINKILFDEFINNYVTVYDNNFNYLFKKTQDLVYRLHLLINHILIDKYNMTEDDIYNKVFCSINNNSKTIYDAINYDENALEEILRESKGLNII